MKKFIFTILIFFLISCAPLIPRYVFQRAYSITDSTLVIKDVYKQLNKYGIDSIPMNLWITSYTSMDTNRYVQKMIRYEPEKKKHYVFIYTKFMYPKKTYYEFKIRYLGK